MRSGPVLQSSSPSNNPGGAPVGEASGPVRAPGGNEAVPRAPLERSGPFGGACPDCGGPLVREGRCGTCPLCGYSACG
jgi:hypothetical protein